MTGIYLTDSQKTVLYCLHSNNFVYMQRNIPHKKPISYSSNVDNKDEPDVTYTVGELNNYYL